MRRDKCRSPKQCFANTIFVAHPTGRSERLRYLFVGIVVGEVYVAIDHDRTKPRVVEYPVSIDGAPKVPRVSYVSEDIDDTDKQQDLREFHIPMIQ
jgi:hypothetical protein